MVIALGARSSWLVTGAEFLPAAVGERCEMMTNVSPALRLAAVAIDCPRPRELAEFYAQLLGWEIDESESDERWVELAEPEGSARLAFQYVPDYLPPTWPSSHRQQMMHLDIRVSTVDEGRRRALDAGATPLPQPEDKLDRPFRVYADPAGHPFCMCAKE